MRNVLSLRNREARPSRDDVRRPRDGVRVSAGPRHPSRRAQQLLLALVDDVAALRLQLRQKRVVDRGLDDQVAVGRTA